MGDIEKLDMSLDDIIKKHDKKPAKTAGAAGNSQRARIQEKRRGGAAAGGRGDGRAARGANKPARAPLTLTGPLKTGKKGAGIGLSGKGVRKVAGKMTAGFARGGLKRGGGFAGAGGRMPVRDREALAGSSKWTHDLFVGAPRPAPAPQRQQQQGATLLISNLNYNVSTDDIKELFSSIGPLISYGINYDRSGRSEGTAHVVYRSKEQAMAAMKRYNNVALDNQKMVISLREPSNPNVLTTLSSGISVTNLGRGNIRANQPAARNPGPGLSSGRGAARGRGGRSSRGRGGRGQGRAAGGADDMEMDG